MTSTQANTTVRRFAWLLGGITGVFAAVELVANAGISPHLKPLSLREVTSNILFAIGFGGPLVLHFSSLPGWREVGRTLALGCCLAALLLIPWAMKRGEFSSAMSDAENELIACHVVMGFGLASIVVLTVRAWRGTGLGRTLPLLYLLPSLITLVFTFVAGMYMNFTTSFFTTPRDDLAFAADAAHGFQPSFATGRLFLAAPILKAICFAIYVAPSPALVFVYTLQLRSRRPPAVDVVTELLILVLAGYALYFLCPVCGPKIAFGDSVFPNHPPPVAEVLSAPPLPRYGWRNAMPSLHLASVVLAYWLARPFQMWIRVIAGVFVAGNFLATMGLGEHYFVDLLVAMPLTLLVHAALTPGRPESRSVRRAALSTSATLLVVWYGLLFFGMPVLLRLPGSAWAVTIPTVAAVFWLERKLYVAVARSDS